VLKAGVVLTTAGRAKQHPVNPHPNAAGSAQSASETQEQEREIKGLKQGSFGLQLNQPKEEEREVRKTPF
jgi:hypothetical protein